MKIFQNNLRWGMVVAGLVLLMLFFGLKPFGYSFENKVNWLSSRHGIRIENYGIAFAKLHNAFDGKKGFSFEIALQPADVTNKRFMLIMMMYGDSDSDQLVLAQWKSALVLMNGDDYRNRLHTPRLIAANVLNPGQTLLVSVRTSQEKGTSLYLDGALASQNANLTLKAPDADGKTCLILGNSVYNHHAWLGEIYGMAVYPYALSEKEVVEHAEHWKAFGDLSTIGMDNPLVRYSFREGSGIESRNDIADQYHLAIPKMVTALKRKFLKTEWHRLRFTASMVTDVLLNLFGFVPLGVALFAWVSQSSMIKKHWAAFITVGCCFGFSLMIETIQTWMPSRTSSMLDLILNTFGGGMGVAICYFFAFLSIPNFKANPPR